MNDYIIVGGGIGGLYFIDKLLDKGVVGKILLIEKTARLGGRVSSGGKFNYEIGAGRFHSKQEKLINLLKKYKYTEKDFYLLDNSSRFIPTKKYKKWYDLSWIFGKLVDASKKLAKGALLKLNVLELCEKYLSREIAEYLKGRYEYDSELVCYNAVDGMKAIVGDLSNENKFFVLKGGLEGLVKKMEKKIKQDGRVVIKKECYVEDVLCESGEGYLLKCLDGGVGGGVGGGREVEFRGRKVIFAIDKPGLMKINYFRPHREILNSVVTRPLLRMYAKFARGGGGGGDGVWFAGMGKVVTDDPIRYIIPINEEAGVIMISYTDGGSAEYWNRYLIKNGKEKLKKKIMEHIRKLFPGKVIPDPEYFESYYWENGASYWRKNKDSGVLYKKIMKLNRGRDIYICGESYSKRQAWIEGALENSSDVFDMCVSKIKGGKRRTSNKGKKKVKTAAKTLKKKVNVYTMAEVSKHNKQNDMWIVINGNVLDVTRWKNMHPGGAGILTSYAGKDATTAFVDRGHSNGAKKKMRSFIIGKLKG